MVKPHLYLCFILAGCVALGKQVSRTSETYPLPNDYRAGAVLVEDDFSGGLEQWVVEGPQNDSSRIRTENGQLLIDVNGGATVWLNRQLSGNYQIEYTRTVLLEGGPNDRLSDLNQFWMAQDPHRPNLFTRSGVFSEYDSLLLYYVGVGGNYNSTTRFRKYEGNGERELHLEHNDPAHLLQPNKTYHVRTVVYNGTTRFYLDGQEFFSFQDPSPIREGFFGFRTTESRQIIDNFRVTKLR